VRDRPVNAQYTQTHYGNCTGRYRGNGSKWKGPYPGQGKKMGEQPRQVSQRNHGTLKEGVNN